MKEKTLVFRDSTTGDYFLATSSEINRHVCDIRTETCHKDISYVDLIRDFQDRLGISKIEKPELCHFYGALNGRRLVVYFTPCLLHDRVVHNITYHP